MNKKNIFFILSIVLFGGVIFFGRGYIQNKLQKVSTTLKGSFPKADKVNIVASFYPLAYFAGEVGGREVAVRNLTPSGMEPHDFEPSPRDLASLRESDLFIYNGASFEPWVARWLQTQNLASSHLNQSIDIVSEIGKEGETFLYKDNNIDPHIWLDPIIAQKEVMIIRDTLIQVDPLHQEKYRSNAENLLRRISSLDGYFREALASCALRDIIVSHDAFGYLAKRYALSATSIAGISPDEEPSSQELIRIISLAHKKGIQYIFSETMANPKFAETVAREIGGGLLVLNPIESLTYNEVQSGEDYLSLMMVNLHNLKTALVCN